MALTAFTSRLGRGQGRLATSKATGGDYAFVLGDDEAGRFFELAPGDHAEVTQETDLTSVMLVRALLCLRVPASTPAGRAWEASIVVDGTKLARMQARPGRERLVTDLAANVSKLSGLHTIGVRLELVTA
jgi:aminoglycoside phosphotransferase